jgi:hypothetical protein
VVIVGTTVFLEILSAVKALLGSTISEVDAMSVMPQEKKSISGNNAFVNQRLVTLAIYEGIFNDFVAPWPAFS